MRLLHLLDDFAFGGVSRALTLFDRPEITALAQSRTEAVASDALVARAYDADIIVLHFPPNWRRLAWVASLRWRNPAARIIWVEHSYTGAWEALKVPSPARFRQMLGMAYRMADAVVCVSQGQAVWLREVTGLASITVIHPFAENDGLAELPWAGAAARGPLRIGAYGRFCEQKGFDLLIRAHRSGWMPDTQLVIGGFGPDEAALRALAAGDPMIRFVGRVGDVAGFLAQVDAVAVPSRWEAYGMVANEAREAGRALLVAPVDGLPEQVGGAGFTVDFTDPAAMLRSMAALRGADLATLGAAGRAATQNSGARRAGQWAALLNRLTTDRRRAA